MYNILLAASECVPFIKTGGLADVIGSLPHYFDKELFDARVILPKYLCMSEKFRDAMTPVTSFEMFYSGRERYVGVMQLELRGTIFYFIDNEEYFGGPYPYTDGDYDEEKFGFFSRAVLAALPAVGFKPDVIHCNDWHTGMIPVYLHTQFAADSFYEDTRTIMTIHNLRFQGLWNMDDVKRFTGLPDHMFTPDKLEFFGEASYLKGGLVYADRITTVSETYKEEIQTPYFGERLDPLLRSRADVLSGIVNGLDYDDLNPATDPAVYCHFDADTFRKKRARNKAMLQRQLHLDEDPHVFTIGIVSRMTDQKGFDLIWHALGDLLAEDIQLVVLGTGEWKYEDMFRNLEMRFPDRVSTNIFYSEETSRRIYAGTDAFLMPSLFEPCGLSQMMALRYGSVPIVRETGGLKDTVEPYNKYTNEGTGFSFARYDAGDMLDAIRRAKDLFTTNKRRWNQMIERGMRKNFSWSASAVKYQELYTELINSVAEAAPAEPETEVEEEA